jgi:hypothetical protein
MIRITAHSSDPAFLVIRVDRDHNRVIGTFEPARRQDDLGIGVYVMEADKLDSLKAWARFQNIHLLNEARDRAEPTRPLECGNIIDQETREVCCAPYPASRVPKFCGACGQPAKPVVFAAADVGSGVRCPACERVNHGGPAYCLSCASPLPERHLAAPALARVKGEPRPLGEALHELATHIAHDAAHAARARNALHTHNGDLDDDAE